MPTVTVGIPDTTFVSSAQPTQNFSFYPLIYVGEDPTFSNCIGLLEIDLSTIPVNRVDSAMLQLSVIVKTGTDPSTIVVNRILSAFDAQTATYNNFPAFTPTTSQIDVSTTDLYTIISIDITELVNQWLDGTYDNYGIALTNSSIPTLVQFGTNNIVYEPYFPKLVITYSDEPPTPEGMYGYVFNDENQAVPINNSVTFNNNGALLGFIHEAYEAPIIIESAGVYAIWYTITGLEVSQFTLYQNENPVYGSTYGSNGTTYSYAGMVIINADEGDEITLRNHTSESIINLDNSAGGTETNVNASIMILKIGPAANPDPILDEVNNAQTVDGMRDAITNPDLGLDLDNFNTLSTLAQNIVLQSILESRPSLGYLTVASLQSALDEAVNEVVDPENIRVSSVSMGGDGSLAHPFGSISSGIAAVSAGGTVHVAAGTYNVSDQIVVNKTGMTLLGEAGTELILAEDIIAMLISGNGATVKGLTITSATPYAKEFIRIAAPDVKLIGNTVYGPPQDPPMDGWIVNRAVVSQVGTENVLLEENTFYSLRTGMYINPNTTGAINNNVVYNTKGGFLVDGALTTFSGNSWGTPPNEVDIALLKGTTDEPPYDDLEALSLNNSNANISDQRHEDEEQEEP